jgi:pyruvate dehydrogenase E2 component (dihydrolipoamide acetyltransferase)
MATKVVMEALSPTMEEGRVAAWKRKEGDAVKSGDVIAEIETDKAVMDLVARADGIIRTILAKEGQTLPVGSLLGVIGAAGEDISALTGGVKTEAGTEKPAASKPEAAPSAAASASGVSPRPEGGARQEHAVSDSGATAPLHMKVVGVTPAAPGDGHRVLSSPLARRIAAEKGVDIQAVPGSGPGGRVVARDISSARPAAQPPHPSAAAPAGPATEDVPLTQIRKTIAKRLVQSIGPIPHFFLTSEIDMQAAWDLRAALKARGDKYTISFNDLVIKAVAHALRAHRAVNAWWMDDHIRYHGDVHIGMAVAVEDGLITPVIRFADGKGLLTISAEAKALAEKARHRRLTPEEYTGATFSVSNLGMFDIDEFTAVINPPEAGILAIGRIAEKAVVVNGAVVPRRMMRVTMSCDHRVIDGATGAQFLQTVKLNLENPLAMLL